MLKPNNHFAVVCHPQKCNATHQRSIMHIFFEKKIERMDPLPVHKHEYAYVTLNTVHINVLCQQPTPRFPIDQFILNIYKEDEGCFVSWFQLDLKVQRSKCAFQCKHIIIRRTMIRVYMDRKQQRIIWQSPADTHSKIATSQSHTHTNTRPPKYTSDGQTRPPNKHRVVATSFRWPRRCFRARRSTLAVR